MRNVLTACVGLALLLSITGSAQNAKRTLALSRCPEIWRFNLPSAPCRPTSETMQPFMF